MILTRSKIISALDNGDIDIKPKPEESMIGSNSVDFRIGTQILCPLPLSLEIDSRNGKNIYWEKIDICPKLGVVLYPGNLYLASTYEWIGSDKYHMQLHGRSSAARMGLSIHETAAYGDMGFHGKWTLEIFPKLEIRIWPYQVLGQVSFMEVSSDPENSDKDILYKNKRGAIYNESSVPMISKGIGDPIIPKEETP